MLIHSAEKFLQYLLVFDFLFFYVVQVGQQVGVQAREHVLKITLLIHKVNYW